MNDLEEQLGETIRDILYGENPPPLCDECKRLLTREETGIGPDDFEWVCLKCDGF